MAKHKKPAPQSYVEACRQAKVALEWLEAELARRDKDPVVMDDLNVVAMLQQVRDLLAAKVADLRGVTAESIIRQL